MAGRPKKIKVTSGEITTMVVDDSDPHKIIVIDVKTEPLPKVEPETLIEETPKVDEVEEIKPPEPEPEPEKPEEKPVDKIMEKYLELCQTESDINELLPYIYEIALQCETCVEFGVRRPTSTYAFLAAKPKRLVSYDIGRYDEEVTEVENICKEAGQDFEFILGSSAHVTIEETDCALIDTLHTKKMLETELSLHADKIKKFILLHDTFGPYWETGEAPYNDETSPYGGGLGLKYAIEPFLESHPEWTVFARYDFNNGLMILKRS